MKNDLIKYLEYEKNNLSVDEGDFLRILNKIELGAKINTENFAPARTKGLRSPLFAWGFGFSGMAAALFMFVIGGNDVSINNPTTLSYVENTKNTSAYSRSVGTKDQAVSNKDKTIMTIESINSFSNLDSGQ